MTKAENNRFLELLFSGQAIAFVEIIRSSDGIVRARADPVRR